MVFRLGLKKIGMLGHSGLGLDLHQRQNQMESAQSLSSMESSDKAVKVKLKTPPAVGVLRVHLSHSFLETMLGKKPSAQWGLEPTPPSAPAPSPSSLSQVPPGNSSSKRNSGLVVVLSVLLGICGVLLILFVVLFCVVWMRRKKTEESKIGKRGSMALSSYAEDGRAYSSVNHHLKPLVSNKDFLADISQCLDKYNLYSLQDLRKATSDFHPDSLIKGHVYKATIGEEVFALKKMKSDVSEELRILQKVNHSNLVRLDGFCIDASEGECYLVYEYVENGSLYSWLQTRKLLNWKTRVQIAVDVASGLNYIHEHTQPSVVHKDVKSSNILLDRNMRAKIANFGLAKSGCNAITRHIVGTQGYMAPEYLLDGVVTTKMDVFAFGVVLLELVSGRLAVGEGGKLLWIEMQGMLDNGDSDREEIVRTWLDGSLMESGACSLKSVMSVVAIAMACIQKEASARPGMGDIVYMLSKAEASCLDSPSQRLEISFDTGGR
ncbi:LYK5 protein [Nymphaea thermarum]|nr:LYK5 protein [Nymphaea thermarum]